MTDEQPDQPEQDQPSEEELRARLEQELKQIKVRDILLQTVVTLVNLGGQRLGATEQTKDVRDLDQVKLAIEAVRALLPLLEQTDSERLGPVRDALAQLQVVYAREMKAGTKGEGPAGDGDKPDEASGGSSPAEQPSPKPRGSGRLWVPPGSTT